MATVLDAIKKSALSLTEKARIQLAGELLKSVPGELEDSPMEVQSVWDKEISRRIAEIDSGEIKGISAKNVFKSLDKKHGWKS